MKTRTTMTLAALGVFLAAGAADAQEVRCPGAPQEHTKEDAFVPSTDGTRIAVTAFRPADTCRDHPVPIILTLHGWSGSRSKEIEEVQEYLDRRYAVIGIDSRGHGESGGRALVHHPHREVNDFRSVLDWIHDELDYVRRHGRDDDKDVVAGAAGGSYGGGYQLMTAAFDRRLDAIVPEITWNDLPHALAPNGAIKSDWLHLLYAVGKLSVDVDRRIDEWYLEAMATNRTSQANVASFTESSPAAWMHEIEVPTLLIQGLPDTLFPLNEAVHNFQGIRTNFHDHEWWWDDDDDDEIPPVWLVGINSGHVLPGIQPTAIPSGPSRESEIHCIDLDAMVWDFYDTFLKGDDDAWDRLKAMSRVVLPTEQDTEEAPECVSGDDWPPTSSTIEVPLDAVPIPQAGGSILLPLLTAEAETTIAGIPTFSASVPLAELDEIFYLSLVVRRDGEVRVVHDQVQGARTQLASIEGTFAMELGGVATTLQPGDELLLRVDGLNEQYLTNGNRRPGANVFTDAVVSLPVAD